MSRKVTTEQFVEQAKVIHNNKYNYSKTEYKKAKEKVCIICPIHGEFFQTPDKHLQGKGCILCGYEQQKQTNLKKYGATCSLQNGSVKQKAKNTIRARYGVDNVMQADAIKERQKDSVKQKYGVDNVMKRDEVKDRVKETNQERYGVDNAMQADVIKEKQRNSVMQKYGVGNVMQCAEIKQAFTDSFVVKYGVTNPMFVPEFREKLKDTDRLLYGTEYHIASDAVRGKIVDTNIERYGVDNSMKCDNIKEKVFATNQSRYGGDSPFCSPEVQQKAKDTNVERYGVDNWSKSDEGKARLSEILSSPEVQAKSYQTKHDNGTFNTSKPEEEMYKKLCEKFGNDDVLRNYNTDVRYPFHCDFYIKSLDLFIELNGTWTHQDHFFDENNEEDLATIDRWLLSSNEHSYYLEAIDTWTRRDTLKQKTAIDNNINYLVFWNSDLSDFYEWFNNFN